MFVFPFISLIGTQHVHGGARDLFCFMEEHVTCTKYKMYNPFSTNLEFIIF